MAKIHQLSSYEAQKIAAGEVVERPANVVKELLENALDAGATHITLYVEDGGKQLIRVIDNGFGMSTEDALMCIRHHATSKITTVDDLGTITTFGFRGEALSSIAAVSNVTLITKEATSQVGTKLVIEEAQTIDQEIVTANTGTDITIKNLFYNVPARKKFLKTRDTEWRAILQLFQALCIDYHRYHFILYHDGKLVMNCPPVDDLTARIAQVFDTPLASNMLTASCEDATINLSISGALSQPQYGRYDRNHIFFFVNNRWIKNYKLAQALIKGYGNILPQGKFPAAFIFITTEPAFVDINIHPRKEEVHFLHPRKIETALELMAQSALKKNFSGMFQEYAPREYPMTSRTNGIFDQGEHIRLAPDYVKTSDFVKTTTDRSTGRQGAATQNTVQEYQEPVTDFQILGQLHKTYILLETAEGLTLVDQHAAHERILYEQFTARFNEIPTIALLFPELITLTLEDCKTIVPHLSLFSQHGINLEQFNATQLTVHALPVHLKNQSIEEFVRLVINCIHEHQTIEQEQFFKIVNEKLHAQIACKAAVKAGDILTHEHMHELITNLTTAHNRLTCPHGRPTSWQLSISELERKFKRKL